MKKKNKIVDVFKNYDNNINSVSYYFEKFGELAIGEDNVLRRESDESIKALLKKWGFDMNSLNVEGGDIQYIDNPNENSDGNLVEKSRSIKIIIDNSDIPVVSKLLSKHSNISNSNFEILSKGSFLMLNNYFEYLIADLLSYYYGAFQDSLKEREFKISLKEINEYESIDELTTFLIQKEVETILIENTFESLLLHFEKKFNISLEKEIINWDLIKEYRERRHIIVHNSSIVNKKYIARSGNPYNFKIGNIVNIDKDYFDESLQTFQLAGFLLVFNCWGSWEKDDIDTAIFTLMEQSFYFLKNNKNDLARGICKFCDKLEAKNDTQEDYLLRITVNKCIVLKRMNDKTSLKKELKKIKVGTASPLYKIAHQILDDNDENLLDNIKKAKSIDEINTDKYLNWPLFEFLRNRTELHEEILNILRE